MKKLWPLARVRYNGLSKISISNRMSSHYVALKRSELDSTHLPAGHLAEVAYPGVVVALDRVDRGIGWQLERLFEPLLVAPKARWDGDISGLIKPVIRVALSHDWDLRAK